MKPGLLKLSISTIPLGIAILLASGSPAKSIVTSSSGPELFASRCAICHGKNGSGLPNWRAKGQPDFTDAGWQKSRSDSQIADVISGGKGKYMPSFASKLAPGDVSALVAQVRAFARKK